MAITSLSRYATEAAASFPSRMAVFSRHISLSQRPRSNTHFYRVRAGTSSGWASPREVISVTAGLSEMPINGACVEHAILRGGNTMEALRTNTRISLSNILVTTDFSQVSKNALPYAAALARQYEAKIIVAHALSPEPHLSVPVDPLPAEADPAFLEAQGKLAEFALGQLAGSKTRQRCC